MTRRVANIAGSFALFVAFAAAGIVLLAHGGGFESYVGGIAAVVVAVQCLAAGAGSAKQITAARRVPA